MTSVRGQAVMRKKKCWRKSGGDDTASDCVFGCEKNGSGEVAKRRGGKKYISQNNGECGIPAQVWATSSLLMTFSFLHLSPEGSYQPCNSAELISRRVGGGWEEEEVLQGGGAGYLRAP